MAAEEEEAPQQESAQAQPKESTFAHVLDFLGKELGPFPLGVWLLILAGGFTLAYLIPRLFGGLTSTAAPATDTGVTTVDTGTSAGTTPGAGAGGGTGNTQTGSGDSGNQAAITKITKQAPNYGPATPTKTNVFVDVASGQLGGASGGLPAVNSTILRTIRSGGTVTIPDANYGNPTPAAGSTVLRNIIHPTQTHLLSYPAPGSTALSRRQTGSVSATALGQAQAVRRLSGQ